MKLLIPTEPDDTQAIVVKLALEERGHEVRLFFTADFPTKQKNAIYLDDKCYYWHSVDEFNQSGENNYDVVWWRRPRKPWLPKQAVHPEDLQFVQRENLLFYESLTANLAPQAWWVNPKEAARKSQFKLFQLELAKSCGLKIPQTLCSNNPESIKAFIRANHKTGVIYKPLCAGYWFEEEKAKLIYTTRINEQDLPAADILQSVPGIYQAEIKKQHELRVTCFGDLLVAAKICSQEHPGGITDWRAIPKMQIPIEPCSLPSRLQERIRKFMRQSGLVFGCFDFIVSEKGDYIFLEVNEQGQFLWLEEFNPAFAFLDMFIHFLLGRSSNFSWNPRVRSPGIQSWQKEVHAIYLQNMQRHVELNSVEKAQERNQA